MEEFIQVQDQYYILATSARVDDRTRVLKHNETFAVFDRAGNIRPFGLGEQGIYHQETRYVSRLELSLSQRQPMLLGSMVPENNSVLSVDLTNPDIPMGEGVLLPRDTIHVFRYAFLWNAAYYSRYRVRNFSRQTWPFDFAIRFEADFADVFEVRGIKREKRGIKREAIVDASVASLSYEGLDRLVRSTRLEFTPAPSELTGSYAKFQETIAPGEEKVFFLTIRCHSQKRAPSQASFIHASEQIAAEFKSGQASPARVETSNDQFNHWLNRSSADLQMMITQTEHGPYPYAGIPWFSTAFGRDGLITAFQYLAFDPTLARGVLQYLAANQARETVREQDAQPGKVLHEVRHGEMAALKEIPFGSYYGSVDSTPLFVLLCGAYFERTADKAFIQSIWHNIEAALQWIDKYGDSDADGFVEYVSQSPRGLANQGWKDSVDSVFHRDGTLATAPIALCEVQGYVFAAKRYAAMLAEVLDQQARADTLRAQAEQLRQRFDEAYWCEDLSTYAMALDHEKRPCCVRSSNAGQCLFTGIAQPHRVAPVIQTLLSEDSFSGWGIRTVPRTEARYNPMSYHNGSIWPHDNSLIASGFARLGHKQEALKIMGALFEASKFVELNRMPELLCGFARRPGEGPTQYPVACAPQAWSAAAVFLLLQSCLGISFDAPAEQIRISASAMPPYLNWISIKNVALADTTTDLHFRREGDDVMVAVPRKQGRVQVMVIK